MAYDESIDTKVEEVPILPTNLSDLKSLPSHISNGILHIPLCLIAAGLLIVKNGKKKKDPGGEVVDLDDE